MYRIYIYNAIWFLCLIDAPSRWSWLHRLQMELPEQEQPPSPPEFQAPPTCQIPLSRPQLYQVLCLACCIYAPLRVRHLPIMHDVLIKALQWLDHCQFQENARHFEVMNRHRSRGTWPFSTREQGYNISDCTGEGLKAVLLLQTQLEYVIYPGSTICMWQE